MMTLKMRALAVKGVRAEMHADWISASGISAEGDMPCGEASIPAANGCCEKCWAQARRVRRLDQAPWNR